MFDPATFTEAFEREHGATEAEWLGQLPGAVGAHPLSLSGQQALVTLGDGELRLSWAVLPPRRIALITLPRLQVAYRFRGVPHAERVTFLRYFDLFMQKGGG